MRLLIIAPCLALSAACSVYPAAVPLDPVPAEYPGWWSELADCTGSPALITWERLRFYVTVRAIPRCWFSRVMGCWRPPGHVYLSPSATKTHVMHEFLHAWLQSPWHGNPAWKRCRL